MEKINNKNLIFISIFSIIFAIFVISVPEKANAYYYCNQAWNTAKIEGSCPNYPGSYGTTSWTESSNNNVNYNWFGTSNSNSSVSNNSNSTNTNSGNSSTSTKTVAKSTSAKKVASTSSSKTTDSNTSTTSTNNTATTKYQPSGSEVGSLAAGAIFGSNGFLPSSIFQWIFFFILILLGIILWRKLYVSDEEKHKPLKHA